MTYHSGGAGYGCSRPPHGPLADFAMLIPFVLIFVLMALNEWVRK